MRHRQLKGLRFITTVFVGVLSFLLFTSATYAEESAAVVTKAPSKHISIFDAYFYEGLNAYFDKKTTETAEKWELLREEGEKKGYHNFPDFSAIILEQAKFAIAHKEFSDAQFLINKALSLSPQRAQIHLSVATFYQTIGIGQAIGHVSSGLKLAIHDTYVLIPLLRNFLLLALFALSVAFLVFAIIHVCVQRELIINKLSLRIPEQHRRWLTPTIFYLLNALPLLLGLFPALAIWSIVLAHHVYHCRKLAIYVSVIILCWAVLLPVFENVSQQAIHPLAKAMGNISLFSYSSEDLKILQEYLAQNPDDPMALVLLGQKSLIDGNLTDADKYLSRYLQLPGKLEFMTPVNVNLGITYLMQNQAELASAQLIKAELQETSVQFFYVYAQLMLQQLNTKQNADYYQKALKRDKDWLMTNEQYLQDNLAIASRSLPVLAQVFFYLQPHPLAPQEVPHGALNTLVGTMAHFHSNFALYSLGFITLFFAVISSRISYRSRNRSNQKNKAKLALRETISVVWLIIPGGYHLRSSYPFVGTLNFAILLMLLTFRYNEPSGMFPILLVDLEMSYLTPVVIVLFLLLGLIGFVINKATPRQVG
ncbi:MAG: hypothetical protein IT292_10615 [Deltaproteobacteria bacterium]|nr:hypothetical protein [Deltaproteobacteria bacterium]